MSNNPRNALGNISTSALNSRKSLGQSKPGLGTKPEARRLTIQTSNKDTKAPPRPSTNGSRFSVAPKRTSTANTNRESVSGRRVSLHPMMGQTQGPKTDPRPTKEKLFQAMSVQTLVEYLNHHNYEKILTPQNFPPSTKEFVNIFQFLMQRIDSGFKYTKKPEEEIPLLLKMLRYPFSVSGRSLLSVGSTHAWPNWLAALVWFIDLLNYDEIVEQRREESLMNDEQTEEDNSKLFFDFVSTSYHAFMDNNDDVANELEQAYASKIHERNEALAQATAELDEHSEKLLLQYDALEKNENRVSRLKDTLSLIQSDIDKFTSYIDKLEQRKQANLEKFERQKATQKALVEEVSGLEHEMERLQQVLQAQQAQNLDINKIRKEQETLATSMNMTVAHREELDNSADKLEMEIGKFMTEIQQSVSVFNHTCRQLELGKLLDGELKMNVQSKLDIFSLNLKSTVRPRLHDLTEEWRLAVQQETLEVHNMKSNLEQLETRLYATQHQRAGLEEKQKMAEETLQREQALFAEEWQKNETQKNKVMQQNTDLKFQERRALSFKEEELLTLESEYTRMREVLVRENDKASTILVEAVSWIVEINDHLSEKLAKFEGVLDTSMDQLAK